MTFFGLQAAAVDADLLTSCARYQNAEAAYRATAGKDEDMVEPAGYEAAAFAVGSTSALTLAGMQAKARAVQSYFASNDQHSEGLGLGDRMLWSLVDDLARPIDAAKLDGELLAACAHFQHVDAECARFDQQLEAANDEVLAAGADWCPALDRVLACPAPRTPQGLQAKARAALAALKREAEASPDDDWRETASPDVKLAMLTLLDVVGEG